MANQLIPVILAGGQGTRLWPLSRSARPKQFLSLTGKLSPFQETLLRVADASRYLPPIVITNAEYRFIVGEQAEELGIALAGVLLEPVARNTTAAIAAAAVFAEQQFGADAVIHVLPSDHAVDDRRQLLALGRCRRQRRGGRPARDLRHRADRARDRLWLYRGRRRARRRHLRGRPLRRKARPRQGRKPC